MFSSRKNEKNISRLLDVLKSIDLNDKKMIADAAIRAKGKSLFLLILTILLCFEM